MSKVPRSPRDLASLGPTLCQFPAAGGSGRLEHRQCVEQKASSSPTCLAAGIGPDQLCVVPICHHDNRPSLLERWLVKLVILLVFFLDSVIPGLILSLAHKW